MAKKLTSTKARKILHDKEVHGQPLTDKQRKFFGAIAGGAEPYKAQIGTKLTSLPANYMETLSEALGFPQKAVTKMVTGKYQTPSEAMGIKNKLGAFATDAILDPLNLLFGAGAAKTASKVSKVAAKPKITPILSQEEAVRARAQRMLEQERKWRGQDNRTLRNKFETAVERHDPASDYPGSKIGANTGEATQISRHANLSDANKARMAAHEVGHYYHNAVEEANAWNKYFDWSVLDNLGIEKIHKIKQYLTGSKSSLMSHYPGQTSPSGVLNQWKPKGVPSGDELRERAAQLKDYIAYKNNIPLNKDFKITRSQLDDAVKSYVKETGLDNNMTPFLEALKKKGNISGFLKEMNKRPLVIAPAVLAGAETIEQKQNGGWLDKYDAPQAQNGIEGTMGGLTDVGFNYNGAWGGTMQMGGVLPGAVGFTYARTAGAAPANGPYAKKTKASAQNGQEMKYYQEGLDFKPKTISQDGSDIPVDPMGYWNPENVGNPVIIPSNIITMEGVDQPLLGISDTGDVQYMEPGEDYEFDGEYVTEYPVAQKGKRVPIVVSDPRDKRLTRYNDSLALYNNYVQNKNLIESTLRPQFKKMGYEDINKYTEPYSRDRYLFELPDGSSTVQSYGKEERVTAPQYKTDKDAINRRKVIRHKVGNITVPEYEQLWSTSIAPVRTTRYNPGDGFYSIDKNFTGDIYSIDKTELVPYDIRKLEDSPKKRKMLKERAEFVKKWPYTITPSKFNYSFGIDEYVEPVQPVVYREPEAVRQTIPPAAVPSSTSSVKSASEKVGMLDMFGKKDVELLVDNFGNYEWFRKDDDIGDLKPIRRATREEIEYSKKQKQRNGGVNNADAQPLKKLDQLLNFTNYNKPTKGGWLDKYN